MSSSGKRPRLVSAADAAEPADVRSLYEQCLASEKLFSRELDEFKRQLVLAVAFGGPVFDAFSNQENPSPDQDSELASKYRLLRDKLREAKSADGRLRLVAQWLWAELGVEPESHSAGDCSLTSVRKQ